MMLRWIKRVVVAVVLLAIGGVIAWSLVPKPVPVEVGEVTRGPMQVTVDEDGRARVEDRHVVVAPIAGSLARIALDPGDTVAAEAVIASIAPMQAPLLDARSRAELEGRLATARAQRRQAEAAVERARTTLEFARNERDRQERLAAQGAGSRQEYDRRALEAETAARDLESARFAARVAAHEVSTAEAMLARATRRGGPAADEEVLVRSPVTGRVLRVLAESEGVVSAGTPLIEVGDPSRLEIVVDVLTADAVAIAPGAAVTIDGWGGRPLAGRVRMVEPSAVTKVSALGVEEQRVAVIVDLVEAPEAWAALGDGWRVEAQIVTWEASEVVRVPLGALFRVGERWAVFVAEGDRARRRLVEIGQRSGREAEVVGGLEEGDRVVLHPSERVEDGIKIETR